MANGIAVDCNCVSIVFNEIEHRLECVYENRLVSSWLFTFIQTLIFVCCLLGKYSQFCHFFHSVIFVPVKKSVKSTCFDSNQNARENPLKSACNSSQETNEIHETDYKDDENCV